MTGWIGDFFRFGWALFYWNTRKTWFRLRGARRDSCPCQNQSDSGLALETRCDAIMHWSQPAGFQRVCPLLRNTPAGWRCGADAAQVRPFWGQAVLFGAGAILALYLISTIAAFVALRSARYDVDYLSLVWPPRWSEVRGSQERLYARRAQRAIAAGKYQEAILSLEMVCQLNPRNYGAGLALAQLSLVASGPAVSGPIYERLMRDVPAHRNQTAQLWFRTLLAQSDFGKIKPLAATMLSEDPAQRGAWLHALLFAARATADGTFLATVAEHRPDLPAWCVELIMIERALLQSREADAWPKLTRFHAQPESAYIPYYQADRLLRLGQPDAALKLLNTYGARLPADEAAFLRLRAFGLKGWTSLREGEQEALLLVPLSARLATLFCADLVNHADPSLQARFLDRLTRVGPALTAETLPVYHAAFLTAELAGDKSQAEQLAGKIANFAGTDARALRGLAALLKTNRSDGRLARLLPLVPLPTEVVYAILERTSVPSQK